MLVLARTPNERIKIVTPAGIVTITVVSIRGDRVKLGVEAPEKVKVFRDEIFHVVVKDHPEYLSPEKEA